MGPASVQYRSMRKTQFDYTPEPYTTTSPIKDYKPLTIEERLTSHDRIVQAPRFRHRIPDNRRMSIPIHRRKEFNLTPNIGAGNFKSLRS